VDVAVVAAADVDVEVDVDVIESVDSSCGTSSAQIAEASTQLISFSA